jgi:hypothetical protein
MDEADLLSLDLPIIELIHFRKLNLFQNIRHKKTCSKNGTGCLPLETKVSLAIYFLSLDSPELHKDKDQTP